MISMDSSKEQMETSTETFLTTSSEELWQRQEGEAEATGCSDRMLSPSVDPGNPTKRKLEEVEAELAIANAELSSLKQLLSMAEAQLREVVTRSAIYVRDVQNAATKEIYNTISQCNSLLRKMESNGDARQLDFREEPLLSVPFDPTREFASSPMIRSGVMDPDLSGDEYSSSLLAQLKESEEVAFETRIRLAEAERELYFLKEDHKKVEEPLQLAVLTALKLQDVLVMQKIVTKLEHMAGCADLPPPP